MNPENKCRIVLFVAVLLAVANVTGFPNMASSGYQISQDEVTAGGGNGTSASFRVSEASLRFLAGGSLSSANYSLEGKTGINANINIPAIQSITPAAMSRFYTDQNASFTVQASTPDNVSLQYQSKQDGTVKAGPQASSTLAWALGLPDKGRHTVSFSAIGPDGTTSSSQSMYAFRRPMK